MRIWRRYREGRYSTNSLELSHRMRFCAGSGLLSPRNTMDLPGEARDGQECEMVLPTLLSKWQKRTHPGGTPDPGRLAQSWDHRGSKYCETRLNDHGIEPAPERKRQTPWKTFLAAHWDELSNHERLSHRHAHVGTGRNMSGIPDNYLNTFNYATSCRDITLRCPGRAVLDTTIYVYNNSQPILK